MGKSRWDECCPLCNAKVFNIYDQFVNRGDYSNAFRAECPNCKREFQVEVHTVPEFEFREIDQEEGDGV